MQWQWMLKYVGFKQMMPGAFSTSVGNMRVGPGKRE